MSIKILHISSFLGNIGDNISNIGLYNILNNLLNDTDITQLEIRKFYNNCHKSDKMYFNIDFISYINSFDLCIFGGGGFLTYNIDSPTGCTISLAPDLLKNIKIPILFSSLGCNNGGIYEQYNPVYKDKFKAFINNILDKDNMTIMIRNDGSIKRLQKDCNFQPHIFTQVLDNGFFYCNDNTPPISYK